MYYGDEIGMTDVDVPWEQRQDPFGKEQEDQASNRDPERTPMQWDDSPNAGFCPPDVTPWLPIANDYRTVNVAMEDGDPQSMLSLTRALLQLRRDSPALEMGAYTSVGAAAPDMFVYTREGPGERYLIALNFSGEDRRLTVEGVGEGEVILSTCMDRTGREDLSAMSIRSHEGVIARIR
jgi:alpha-glucosidase